MATSDWLGWIAEGDQQCGIACLIPQGHPCSAAADSNGTYCFGGDEAVQCIYCNADNQGPAACGDFVESCAEAFGDDTGADTGSGGSADTGSGGSADTGTGGSADTGTGGSADTGTGGAGAGPSVPDDSLFTSNPDVIFGTTQAVLDLFGDAAPPNLVAEDICDVWDPENAVDDWFGEPLLKKEALLQTIDNAEMLLGYCDHLKLDIKKTGGVELVSFDPKGLADELGFLQGDILLSLNDVRLTDLFAIQNEIIEISRQNPGLAEIEYYRNGKTRTVWVRVE